MEKLIITVTCDSTMSYPSNPHNPTPKGLKAVADEYVRGIEAGALHRQAGRHRVTAALDQQAGSGRRAHGLADVDTGDRAQ